MASHILKKPCCQCNKGLGILTCDGCEQSFCAKHILDHRQEMSVEIEKISQQYERLRRDLAGEDEESYSLLRRIDTWEKESIAKIRQVAQQARMDLQECITRHRQHITNVFNKLTDEFQSSRQSENYNEIDIKLWNEQISELQRALEKVPHIETVTNDDILAAIRMIRIREKTDVHFSRVPGVASTTGTFENLLAMRNSRKILSLPHMMIRFRIEKLNSHYLLFGIINSLEPMTESIFNSSSLYGWMAPDVRVIKSRKLLSAKTHTIFCEHEEILFTINCNTESIVLEHLQSHTVDRLPIDLRICPFPWRLVVGFSCRNDSVRIIP